MKRRLRSSFVRGVIEAAIEPKRLVHQRWLDFKTQEIEWDMWEPRYAEALARRRARGAPELPEEEAELLVVLMEALAFHVAASRSYIGGVELQIVTHSMISYRFTTAGAGNWGERFRASMEEILTNVRTPDDDRFARVLLEAQVRVAHMYSPIIDCEHLCYEPGTVMGIDRQVNY